MIYFIAFIASSIGCILGYVFGAMVGASEE